MRRIETLIVLLALGFYAWFLHRFGWADVLHYVRVAGWGLVLTVSLEALARLANTVGWRVTVENCPPRVGLSGGRGAGRDAGPGRIYHRRDAFGVAVRGQVPPPVMASAKRARVGGG